jgi:protein-disulfide isomerase
MSGRPAGLVLVAAVLAVTGLALGAAAQVHLTVEPFMTKGPATAPVTIVEFSDYQ